MKKVLNNLQSLGAYINPKVIRKKINGVYGMYATEDISQGETLINLPSKHRLHNLEIDYPENFKNNDKYFYSVYKELEKGKKSQYSYIFKYFEDVSKTSSFFYNEQELEYLKSISLTLHIRSIINKNDILSTIKRIKDFDSNIIEENLLKIVVNYNSRGYKNGFLPGVDLFNHSLLKGDQHFLHDYFDQVYTPTEVKKGEQVYISYGFMDLYEHDIKFNYYDPEDLHLIVPGYRISNLELSTMYEPNFLKLVDKYNIKYYKEDQNIKYNIHDKHMFFTINGFSTKLIEFIKDYNSLIGENKGTELILSVIDSILDSINPTLEPPSPKLQRHLNVVKKEKEILENCKKLLIS